MGSKYLLLSSLLLNLPLWGSADTPIPGENPLFRDIFTADPATLVDGDTVYLYTGHDEAKGDELFTMKDWLCFSSTDMRNWTEHGSIMKATDFKWASQDAWAAQVVKKGNEYYLYTTVRHNDEHPGMSVGVAKSMNPTGPFVDALGKALITDDTTPSPYSWNDIDPSVLIDDDGTAWLTWGNPICYLVKLKDNMIELDGPIHRIPLPNYTEGPWLSKRKGIYYLTYAAFAHQGSSEHICYATASNPLGPWTYQGELTGQAKYSYTIHPAIVDDFKGQSYFLYHNADLTLPDGQTGAVGRRAVCIEYLTYNPDGTIQPIEQTKEGISLPPNKPSGESGKKREAPAQENSKIEILRIVDFFPERWNGKPSLITAENPYYDTPICTGFNMQGGISTIGQSFVAEKEMLLTDIAFYGGDGTGTDSENPLTLHLYDMGIKSDEQKDSYSLETKHQGIPVTYVAQAPGLFRIKLKPSSQVRLQKDHCYILELEGAPHSSCFYWRRSSSDIYKAGDAYLDRKRYIDENGSAVDFAFALYGKE